MPIMSEFVLSLGTMDHFARTVKIVLVALCAGGCPLPSRVARAILNTYNG